MSILFISRWQQLWKALHLPKLILLYLIFFSWSLPVHAATQNPINSRLEEKVLQIIRDHPEVIVESVQTYQKQQDEQQQQKQQAFLQQMRANPQKMIGESQTTGA